MLSPRRLPGWARALVALVVVGALAVPLGGWDTVERGAGEVQVLEPGERHSADQYATRIDRAEVVDVRPGSSLDPEPGVAYLAVYGRVENRTDATVTPSTSLLSVRPGGRALDDVGSILLVADGSSTPDLQPGLEAEVVFVWEIEEGEVVAGDDLEVAVVDRTEIESYLTAGTTWIDPRVGAVVDLVVG